MEIPASVNVMVPSVITSSPSGGRFDFDDGGAYCGGWQDSKAHGHGICTGPKNVGEYSGSWNFGFEMSGVYRWKNGAVYEGRWQNGKRHGVGVEYNGKWVYKGEWSQGFKGRYGVKASSNSAVKYEGTWANGLQDGYGCETYSDGGYYQGQMCKGLRHGYGVRKSAPYGDSQLNNPKSAASGPGARLAGLTNPLLIHSNSLQSAQSIELDDDSPKPEDGFKPNIERTLTSKNGFVLVAKPLDVPVPVGHSSSGRHTGPDSDSPGSGGAAASGARGARRSSLSTRFSSSRIPGQSQGPVSLLRRGLRLRKQKSTSDLDQAGRAGAGAGGARSGTSDMLQPVLAQFTLTPEELDITDSATVETYTGEWKQDKRNGHGVCERSDGLKYEGQWHNDMKSGYGVTTFKNGSKEEGKYKNNILIVDSKVKRFFQIGGANIRQRIDDAVKMAQQAQMMALKKAEIADARAATARDKAEQATIAALEADRDSQIAFSVARQYSDSQQQQLGMSSYENESALHQLTMMQQPMGSDESHLAQQAFGQHQQPAVGGGLARMQPAGYQQSDSQMQGPGFQLPDYHRPGSHQQQYLGPVEPFNGRRGSFRGGSQQSSSGYQSSNAFALRQHNSDRATGYSSSTGQHQQSGSGAAGGADPLGHLFDHYRSQPGGPHSNLSDGGRRGLMKQNSLDYAQSRRAPRLAELDSRGRRGQVGHLRMYSVDQADEQQGTSNISMRQQQLRHLVTSSEELQQQQQQLAAINHLPAGSSSMLQHSPGSSSFYGTHTPSPESWSAWQTGNGGAGGGQHRPLHQHHQHHQLNRSAEPGGQPRDVHSLADEQLYMADRRQRCSHVELDEGASQFVNYDFTISSSAKDSRRFRRRTASLSRSTLHDSSMGLVGAHHNHHHHHQINRPSATRRQRSASPAVSMGPSTVAPAQQPPLGHPDQFQPPPPGGCADTSDAAALDQQQAAAATANHQPGEPPSNSSRLTLDSSASSASALYRKPSLQVRYDPLELGGLMSREEVAALSHAQREQKRQEAELAAERAKRPLYHLVLSLKEFIIDQKLLFGLLFFNICLFKMFSDLIV